MHSLKGRQHQFRQSTSDADFDRWSKASHWSLDEAIALSLGRAPEIVSWGKLKDHVSSAFVNDIDSPPELLCRLRNNDPV